jgi:monoamine oxidase
VSRGVLIVGGGISGLAAAVQLQRLGYKIVLLESKDQLGGRVRTIQERPFPIELGAEFVHGSNPSLLNAVREAELSLQPVSSTNRLFENGRLHSVPLWEQVGTLVSQVEPRQPDRSFADLSRRFSKRDRQLALGFVEGFHAALPELISSHSLLKAEHASKKQNISEQYRLDHGYGALISALARALAAAGGTVITGARLRAVRWKPGQLTAYTIINRRTESFMAEAALFTVPLGVWKSGEIIFTPQLPHKRDAIDGLEMGHVVKVILIFQTAWWGRDFGFVHAYDEPLPTWWSDPRGPALTGWAGGSKAVALLDRSPAQVERTALKTLERIFNEHSLKSQLRAAHYWNWSTDRDIRGAYSYIPVNSLDLPKLLAAPVKDTLYFAGEATVGDAQMGTVSGALESGLRAAAEISRGLATGGKPLA